MAETFKEKLKYIGREMKKCWVVEWDSDVADEGGGRIVSHRMKAWLKFVRLWKKELISSGFLVCEVESWRKQDQRIVQVKMMALGSPCFEKMDMVGDVWAKMILEPALWQLLLLGDIVCGIFV
jgi:hypothetical protein